MDVPPSAQQTGFYLTYFIVSKKDGGHQPIFNHRCLNQYQKVLPFQMIHTKTVMQYINAGELFTLINFKKCTFTHPDLSTTQAFSSLCFPRPSFPISGSTILPVPGTEGLYSGGLGGLSHQVTGLLGYFSYWVSKSCHIWMIV